MKATCTILAAATLLSVTASHAEQITPASAVSLSTYEVAGRALDIIGVQPGMTAAEAKAALEATYDATGIYVSEMGFRMGKDNVWVETTPFPIEIRYSDYSNDTESFSASLTGLAGDNRVATVQRRVKFDGNGPKEETLIAALVEKYGPPSRQGRWLNGTALIWQFSNGQAVECDQYCVDTPTSYDYIKGQEAPTVDYVIKAEIREGGYWQPNPRGINVYAADLKLINEAAFADFESLKTAWDEKAAVTAPIAAPKL